MKCLQGTIKHMQIQREVWRRGRQTHGRVLKKERKLIAERLASDRMTLCFFCFWWLLLINIEYSYSRSWQIILKS